MSNSNVALVYSGVINDVIDNVRKDFDEYGVDINVLSELKLLWENKIKSAKVAPWETNGLPGEDHDQNNQNINGGSYMQASMQSMQQPMQQPMQQSMQQSMPQSMQQSMPPSDQNINYQQSRDSPAVASLPARAVNINMHLNHNNEAGMPQPHINNGNGNPLPAQLSPSSSFPASSDISNISTPINSQVDVDQKIYHQQNYHPLIGQQDDYGNSMGEKLIPRRETSNNSSPLPEFNTQIDPSFADNDDINSDLDDPEDEDTNADGEETQNIILCLYDKVTRTKNKWKCQLKDGIMSVNGRDYLFQKGNGDFEF